MNKVDFNKLNLKMHTFLEDGFNEEEDEENFYEEVFNINFVKPENIDEYHAATTIDEFVTEDKEKFLICNSYNQNYRLYELIDNLGSNFTEYIGFYYEGKLIGRACMTRIFVDSPGELFSWLDYECPNSMELYYYLEENEKSYAEVEARYIGLIDELTIESDYYSRDLHRLVINAISSLFSYYNLGMYHIYTMPKETDDTKYRDGIKSLFSEKVYKECGFEVLSKEFNLMRKHNWYKKDNTKPTGFYNIF